MIRQLQMKIMLITKYYPPEIGSASVRMKSMMDSFSEQDDVEHITVLIFEPYLELNLDNPHRKSNDKITIVKYGRKHVPRFLNLSYNLNPFTLITFTIFSIRECRRHNPDVIIAAAPPHFNFAIATFLTSLVCKKKFCFDIRDSWVGINTFSSRHHHFYIKLPIIFLNKFMQRLFLHACKKAMLISTVYDSIQKYLLERNIKTPSDVIPNGIDFSELDEIKQGLNKDEILSKHRIQYRKGTKFIIYCGISTGYYKPELLLTPIKQMLDKGRDVVYILVGDNIHVGKLAKNMGIEDHVFLLGNVEHSDLIELLLISNAAFYTLDKDFPNPDCALGTKFLEYIACKLPVLAVANNNTIVSKIINDHQIGLSLNWSETDTIDNSLEKLFDNRKYVKNIENYYNCFVKKFDRRRNNDRLYRKIIKRYQER